MATCSRVPAGQVMINIVQTTRPYEQGHYAERMGGRCAPYCASQPLLCITPRHERSSRGSGGRNHRAGC